MDERKGKKNGMKIYMDTIKMTMPGGTLCCKEIKSSSLRKADYRALNVRWRRLGLIEYAIGGHLES